MKKKKTKKTKKKKQHKKKQNKNNNNKKTKQKKTQQQLNNRAQLSTGLSKRVWLLGPLTCLTVLTTWCELGTFN